MIPGLLWMIGAYGLCIVLVHAAHAWTRGGRMAVRHYVLIGSNQQHRIEWLIRSLLLFGWLRGCSVQITLLDEGSQDDTLEIARKLQQQSGGILTILECSQEREAAIRSLETGRGLSDRIDTIVVELSSPGDLAKLPLLY